MSENPNPPVPNPPTPNSSTEDPAQREVLVARLFSAPAALVFTAWTDPQHFVQWWGQTGVTIVESIAAERLVLQQEAADFTTQITFEDQDEYTILTLRLLFPTALEKQRAVFQHNLTETTTEALSRLADYLPSMTPDKDIFFIERTFNAPRDLVFQAWSEADRLNQWWGPRQFKTTVKRLDFHPGGVLHYCSVTPDGHEIYGTFLYREIVAPERIVFLNGFADAEGNLARHPMMPDWPRQILNTLTLTEHNGKTTLTLRGTPHKPTQAEILAFREALKYLTPGFQGTFDQLEAYLASEANS